MEFGKKPLYRKENKTAIRYQGDRGGHYKYDRHTKEVLNDEIGFRSMGKKQHRGMDYTPLYKFLLTQVGKNWDDVFSEIKHRLDRVEPVFRMVAILPEIKRDVIRAGQSSYWSGLFVDENSILQIVDPALSNEQLYPYCSCCTHTFNGKKFINKHNPEIRHFRKRN